MAAPAHKTIKDLNGTWKLNKNLSDDADATLSLQGISWFIRKTISSVTITIKLKQYDGPAHPSEDDADATSKVVTLIDFLQSAGGLKANTETRSIDGLTRKASNGVWGNIYDRTVWASNEMLNSKIKAEWSDWLAEGWDEDNSEFIFVWNENKEKGWVAVQIWGFATIGGQRRFIRKVFTKTAKGNKSEKLLNVYDFEGSEN